MANNPIHPLGKCLVLGGGGFLGRHIVRQLQEAGADVRIFARHPHPDVSAPLVQGSILDAPRIGEALRGVDTVFHTASLCELLRKTRPYWDVNVQGSRNVLAACRAAGVKRLIYTSTPSVVIGEQDILDGDESLPYSTRFLSPYPETKAVAEKLLLEASSDDLRICALRPHLIWGEDDPHFLPRFIDRARRHALRIIGTGANLVSITHVENAAHAHLQAALELAGQGICAGRAYFVCDSQPINLWEWANALLARLGLPQATRRVSHSLAYALGALNELFCRLPFTGTPVITRFVANQFAYSHTFSHAAATRDFGYAPVVTPDQGLKAIVARFGG
ncbi:MAG: NAD-dependent epimerase/dehydratase family protein [Victivallales bacterium]|nr:NAD-dependent epimerase/dehydratase family protein [Victivallales bacterium]